MTDDVPDRRHPEVVSSLAAVEQRPTQRGMLCVWGFFGFLVAGALLFALDADAWTWPVFLFVGSVLGVMGTSALYHRIEWSEVWYGRMRRLDHAMIFALITGTEAPLFVTALDGRGLDWVFYLALGVSGAGFLMTMFWVSAPKWLRSLVYLAAGWSGVPAAGSLADALGGWAVGLLIGGGVLYSVGAAFYGLRRPNPWPGRFGYHELFHAMVIAAAAAHFAVVAFFVI